MSTHKASIIVTLAALALLPAMTAQTTGIPFINDLYVGPPGALGGAPGGAPCPLAPILLPPATTFSFGVTTPAPGLSVILLADVFGPCLPGIFCLPIVAGPYGALPMSACGGISNVSVDVSPLAVPVFSGITAPLGPLGPGIFSSPPITTPPITVGFIFSLQAVIFDPASGSPLLGMVTSNAIDVMI